ncbi:MAG: hypothetical protein CW341_09685 [Bacteroidetes bacterium]|nr:hypothetical protein [Bacteroidota bacterium]
MGFAICLNFTVLANFAICLDFNVRTGCMDRLFFLAFIIIFSAKETVDSATRTCGAGLKSCGWT